MIEKLLGNADKCFDRKNSDDEVLYGNAGYLYCLLLLVKHVGPFANYELYFLKVIKDILKMGHRWSESKDYILIKWPRDREDDKYYLGGAHGLIGVL